MDILDPKAERMREEFKNDNRHDKTRPGGSHEDKVESSVGG